MAKKTKEHFMCRREYHLDFHCETVKRVFLYDSGPSWPLTPGRQICIVVPGDFKCYVPFTVYFVVVSLLEGLGFIYGGCEYDVDLES